MAPLGRRLADDVGQVGVGDHGRLVHQEEVAGPQPDRATDAALVRQVAQELGGVVGLRDPGGQGVAGRLGRRDADDPAEPGRLPRLAYCGQHLRLAGSGGRVDHRDAPAVGQHRQRRGGLIFPQPGARARRPCALVRVWRAAGQRAFELRQVRAERPRGVGAGHARRALGARQRDHAFFQGQLRVRGVPHSPVPLVDAAPVGAQQAARHRGWFGRLQAGHRLELRGAGPGRRDLPAARRPRPGPGRTGAAPGPGT